MKIYPIDQKRKYNSWDSYFHIGEAIKNSSFIEAFLLSHMLIHQELIRCIKLGVLTEKKLPNGMNWKQEVKKIKKQECAYFDYKTSARVALFMNIIDDIVFKKIIEFNSLRNKFAHSAIDKKVDSNYLKKKAKEGWKLVGYLDSLVCAWEDEIRDLSASEG